MLRHLLKAALVRCS